MRPELKIVTAPTENEERIERYLLDELGGEDRVRLEDRLFHEAGFFELVQSIEDDLILKFVRGELSSQLASRFSEVYMNAPAKRARVEAARAWREAVGKMAGAPRRHRPGMLWLRWPAAAVAALAIVAAILVPMLRKNSAPQFSGFVETPKKTSYASFVLEPGLSRSGGGYTAIRVPPGTDVVRFELVLPYPGGEQQTYQATLGTPERPAQWNGAALREKSSVVASVPSSVLLPGDYTLELQAGGMEVATYSFRVAK